MDKLMQLTGGNFCIIFISIVLATIVTIINVITFVISIKKLSIPRQRKIEYIVIIFSLIIICIAIGNFVGYYSALYKFG